MRRFVSKVLCSLYRVGLRTLTRRPQTSAIDENADADNDRQAHRGSTAEFGGESVTNIAAPTAVKFTSPEAYGSGGKADVARATYGQGNLGDEQVVAVKKVRYHQGVERKKFENEFVHEVELMAGLSHDNIIRLIGFVEEFSNGTAWIVLRWEPNGNVSEFLETGDWEIPERVSLIKDTFEGLKYLHTRQPQICHGDLKSLNILVSSSYRAIITDFGSARAASPPEDAVLGDECGQQVQGISGQAYRPIHVGAAGNQLTLTGPAWSLRWAAPEVMIGERPSLSSDIWAAGWVCWEVMTNQVPFPELSSAGVITLAVIRGEVPSPREEGQLGQIVALCSLMTDCWAFGPEGRPSITRCCNELKWMPSAPPSGGKPSRSKVSPVALLMKKGQTHHRQADYEEAGLLFDQALSVATSAGDQRATAEALEWLGYVYSVQSKCALAEESFTRAQEIYCRIGIDSGRANTFGGLGDVYRVQSRYTQAEESYTAAQEICARIADERGRADTIRGLGDVYRLQSKYALAEESYTRAQEIYASIGSDGGRADTLFGLGDIFHVQSRYTHAEEAYTQAQEIYTRIGNDLGRANSSIGLGEVYRFQSKYTEAEELYSRAQEIYARIGGDLGRASALDGLGQIYRLQSKYAQAEESYIQAQEVSARIQDDRGRANALHGLGEVYHAQSKYTQAEESFLQAHEIHARINNDLGRANALLGLGDVYRFQSKYTHAEESYAQAEEIYARIGDDLARAYTLRSIGHLRVRQGRNFEAVSRYGDARNLFARVGRTQDVENVSHWLMNVLSDHNPSGT